MPKLPNVDRRLPPMALFAAIAWTLLLAGSLSWNLLQERQQSMDLAYADARSNLNKDISFRRWANRHGGVYVPVTPQQQSIPWLAHVPGRDVRTTDGRELTLINPASMMRQIMDSYAEEYGIRGRITGLRYLNPGNAPDAWEREQLEAFARKDRSETWEVADLDGQPHLRHLRAMWMEPGCEKCHAILGYRLGDLRGATGLNLPLTPYFQRYDAALRKHVATHFSLWLLGLFGIGWGGWIIRQRHREQAAYQSQLAAHRDQLEQLVAARTAELEHKNHALEDTLANLKTTQNQLIQSEKLAGLGALVAGVAHELNTPIGNARTVASALGEQASEFGAVLDRGHLKKSELAEFVRHIGEGSRLLDINLDRAADLIHSFKQVAADRASTQRRSFDLAVMVEDVISTLRPSLKHTAFTVVIDIPSGIIIDSYPGPLGQVLINLVNNALVHGFANRAQGRIRIAATLGEKARIHLTVEDDGQGILAEHLSRIYDPFFTTRLGQGGSGLGLNIVHTLVRGVLGGDILVSSTVDQGTRFEIVLPAEAPKDRRKNPARIPDVLA